jgi:hypothetical protein
MYNLSQEDSSKILKIIGKLAGEESTLRIDFQELKFNLGNTKYTLNGKVNFNVIRSKDLDRATQHEEKRIVSPQK